MLKLEAKTSNEQIVLDYLNANVSDVLMEKINCGKKTLSQCWSYIVSEAKKLAQNNCACVKDDTVFGWAIHFFEEDSIDGKKYDTKPLAKVVNTKPKPAVTTPTTQNLEPIIPQEKVVKPKLKPTDLMGQMSIFDF